MMLVMIVVVIALSCLACVSGAPRVARMWPPNFLSIEWKALCSFNSSFG